MKAVILAAGKGTRFGEITSTTPKCLVHVDGRPILDYQLGALRKAGVQTIILVTGHLSDQIKSYVGGEATIIQNKDFETTNSIYSLWLARDELLGCDFVLSNGDIIAEDSLFVDLISFPRKTAALIDTKKQLRDGEMNIVLREGRIVEFGKNIYARDADGESVQIVKFGSEDSHLLFGRIDQVISEGKVDKFPAFAYDIIFRESSMWPVYSEGKRWFEIDTLHDLHGLNEQLLKQAV